MADTIPNMRQLATFVREEDLEELKALVTNLREKADASREDGRTFMMQQYVHLISVVQPQIHRIEKRFARESLAAFRKEHKELVKSLKQQEGANVDPHANV